MEALASSQQHATWQVTNDSDGIEQLTKQLAEFEPQLIVLEATGGYEFGRFWGAATTISGIELMHRIRKGQFDLSVLGLNDTTAPSVWNAVLFNK